MFQQLGTTWHLSDDLFNRLQKFTCVLYSATKNTDRINTLRYNLFCAKKGEIESNQLPPCEDCLRKHCQRANYQAAVWRQSLEACPDIPPPVGKGWSLDTGSDGVPRLSINWMAGQPAPLAVLELLSCKCSRKCSLPDCPCMKNGLRCTDMCRLDACENREEENDFDLNHLTNSFDDDGDNDDDD